MTPTRLIALSAVVMALLIALDVSIVYQLAGAGIIATAIMEMIYPVP